MPTKRDMEAWAVEKYGMTPIEYMMGVMCNADNEDAVRMDAAKASAPYIHPRLKQTELVDHAPQKTPEEIEHDVTELLKQFVQSHPKPDSGAEGAAGGLPVAIEAPPLDQPD